MSSRQLDEEAIFHVARQIPNDDGRSDYLDQVCSGDLNLRSRVESLLEVHEQEGEFLKSSPDPGPTEDRPAITEQPGQQIGRYKLLQEIGEGGFGVVYMAEQQRPVRDKVALKIIKPGMDTKAVVARFEAERQALALMDHANIARVLDGGVTDSGRPYFVMELVKGVPITEYSDKNQLPTNDRLELFITVCQAVQHAHQKGIIHRDLKPSNILVTLADGRPIIKVIDFGVAKAINQQLTEKTLFTTFGQMIGTPQYMSPEQAEMSCLDVDTRSDVYSLGVLLYELLTGTTPLEGERLRTAGYAEVQRIIREEEPPKPSTRLSSLGDNLTIIAKHRAVSSERLEKTVRGDLDWIVMKALDKDRTRRYETSSSLWADVERFLCDQPIEARPPSPSYRVRKFVRRNKGPVVAGATVLFALLTGVIGTSVGFVRAVRETENARRLADERDDTLSALKDVSFELAFSDTMAGDRVRAERAFQVANMAGVSESWIKILRAQLDDSYGRSHDAIRSLEELAASGNADGETQFALLSLLATAHLHAGHDPKYIEYMEQVRALTPRRPEDRLFQALAETPQDWGKSLRTVAMAIEERPVPAALLVRAIALTHKAHDSGDYDALETALRDLEYAELLLGKTSTVLWWYWCANAVGYELTRQSSPVKAEKHRSQMEFYTQQFEALSECSIASSWAAQCYYDLSGDFDALLRMARRTNFGDTVWIEYTGAYIYSRVQDPEAALRTFDSLKCDPLNPSARIARAHFLLEIGERRAEVERVFNDLIAQNEGSPQVLCRSLCLPALMGKPALLRKTANDLKSHIDRRYQIWGMETTIRFLAGDIMPDRLLQDAGSSRKKQSPGRYALGLWRLANGDRDGAKKEFAECVNAGMFGWFEHAWARAFLARMRQDEHWPQWIEPR